MLRDKSHPEETAPSFPAARRGRAWRWWPGLMGLTAGHVLWLFLVSGLLALLAPLGDGLARLHSPTAVLPVPACEQPDEALLTVGGGPPER
jgi:hypothetical protein